MYFMITSTLIYNKLFKSEKKVKLIQKIDIKSQKKLYMYGAILSFFNFMTNIGDCL